MKHDTFNAVTDYSFQLTVVLFVYNGLAVIQYHDIFVQINTILLSLTHHHSMASADQALSKMIEWLTLISHNSVICKNKKKG